MKPSERSAQARRELDRRFAKSNFTMTRDRPRSGWVKAIRSALGMSQAALAGRLSITAPAVANLERAETNGGITLNKLAEVAAALDCILIYTIVPNSSLEATVQRQARRVASERLGYVDSTMALEAQDIPPDGRAEYLDVYARDLIARNEIWR